MSSTFGVQAVAAKLQLGKAAELALNAPFQNPPTGWTFQPSLELNLRPPQRGMLNDFEIDVAGQGGLLLIPKQEGFTDLTLSGQGGLQPSVNYEFP